MRASTVLCCLASLVLLTTLVPAAAAQGGKPAPIPSLAELVIEGSVRGVARGALVKRQIETARQNWKRLYKKEADIHETANFLLLGSVPNKSLKEVGATLEKQLEHVRKALRLEREDPWAGKLAVYLFAERGHYNTFVRGVEKRRLEEGELGTFDVLKNETPHAAAGPGEEALDPSVDGQAGEQMAAAALTYKVGTATLPEWVQTGFGRATTLQTATPAQRAAEHKRVLALLAQKKRTVRDVSGSDLLADEATVLRASVIEYLAYSGRTTRFVPFVLGFQPRENVESPTTDMALAAAGWNSPQLVDALNANWQKWARLPR